MTTTPAERVIAFPNGSEGHIGADFPAASRELVTKTLRAAGVPERLLDATFGSFTPRSGTLAAMKAASALVPPIAEHSVLLVGPPGTGKTHLAAATIHQRATEWAEAYPNFIISAGPEGMLARPPFRSRFVMVAQLLDDIRATYELSDRPDPLGAVRDVPLLVLDDLGREKPSEWVLERLFVLVDHRWGAKLPTLATSNYTADELAARGYGPIISRLLQGGELVTIQADDYRLTEGL